MKATGEVVGEGKMTGLLQMLGSKLKEVEYDVLECLRVG